jgi:hypothetical protein
MQYQGIPIKYAVIVYRRMIHMCSTELELRATNECKLGMKPCRAEHGELYDGRV